MFFLQPNTASNDAYLSLDEARQFLPSFTHYLMVLTRDTGNLTDQGQGQVLTVVAEYERYTHVTVNTTPIEYEGVYVYEVYGQNSASNTDKNSEVIVGLVEQGTCVIGEPIDNFESPEVNIPQYKT